MSREIITRERIDAFLVAGRTQYELAPGTIGTASARERAQDRGLRLLSASVADEPERIRQAVVAAHADRLAGLLGTIDWVREA